MQQARATGTREIRRRFAPRPLPRAPFLAVFLSLSVLLAPDMALAPAGTALRSIAPSPQPVTEVLGGTPVGNVNAAGYLAALERAAAVADADGATFAVARDGIVLWTGAVGRSVQGEPLLASSPQVIGSVTKTFVAAATLALVDEGRLDLGLTIGQALPAHRALPAQVSVRQLLEHRSGIADLFNQATIMAIETSPDRPWTSEEVLATLAAPSRAQDPGWSYSNTNFFVLGLILERVGGATLDEQVRTRFLYPLSLEDTRLLTADDPAPLSAAWATIFWGSGAMVASAADLARWGDALYGGRLLKADTTAQMLTFGAEGYGLGAQQLHIGGRTGVGHTGLLDTYTTLLLHLPDPGVTVALGVNRPRAPLEAMMTARPPAGGPSLMELATEP